MCSRVSFYPHALFLLNYTMNFLRAYFHKWHFRINMRSENHRMFGVGRDLCGSSSPTPLRKQGHLQQAVEDLVQAGLEYLQRRRLHNLPGQPVPSVL